MKGEFFASFRGLVMMLVVGSENSLAREYQSG